MRANLAKFIPVIFAASVAVQAAAGQLQNPGFETGDLSGWSSSSNSNTGVYGESVGIVPIQGDHMAILSSHACCGFSTDGEGLVLPNGDQLSDWNSRYGTTILPDFLGGAIGQTVEINRPAQLTFDFNFVNIDPIDLGILSIANLNTGAAVTFLPLWVPIDTSCGADCCPQCVPYEYPPGAIAQPGPLPVSPSALDLRDFNACAPEGAEPHCMDAPQTGWRIFSYEIPEAGQFSITVALYNQADTFPLSVLLLDNFQLRSVPEPASLALLCIAFAGLGLAKRRAVAKRRFIPAACPLSTRRSYTSIKPPKVWFRHFSATITSTPKAPRWLRAVRRRS